jgi:hypothetical protein
MLGILQKLCLLGMLCIGQRLGLRRLLKRLDHLLGFSSLLDGVGSRQALAFVTFPEFEV